MAVPPRIAKERLIGDPGRRSELRVAKRVHGRPQPASGAMPGVKGDVRLPEFLLEAKSTVRGALSIKHAWLLEIAAEARAQGTTPALAITFTTGDGRPLKDGAWVAVPERLFNDWQNFKEEG